MTPRDKRLSQEFTLPIDIYQSSVRWSLLPTNNGQAQLHESRRIEVGALPADGDMEVGAGSSSRASAQTDDFAALHGVAFFHFEFGKMQIEGEQSLPVIEHDEIA